MRLYVVLRLPGPSVHLLTEFRGIFTTPTLATAACAEHYDGYYEIDTDRVYERDANIALTMPNCAGRDCHHDRTNRVPERITKLWDDLQVEIAREFCGMDFPAGNIFERQARTFGTLIRGLFRDSEERLAQAAEWRAPAPTEAP